MSDPIVLALIGGTGLYALPDIEVIERRALDTPWGMPSAPLVLGRFHGRALVFLARHGEHHHLAPHRVNYRANLWALHAMGVRRVLAVNAVGGIRADLAPRTLALPDQLIDYTWGRAATYGDADGAAVTHIDFGEPYSPSLRRDVLRAAQRAGVSLTEGGCCGVTQGPRLETFAEIARLRRDGCDLVGMTGMPEAALARELDLDYACLAVVANWAAGCDPEPRAITMDEVQANVAAASVGISALLAAMLTMV